MECGILVLGICLSGVYGCRIPGEDVHSPGAFTLLNTLFLKSHMGLHAQGTEAKRHTSLPWPEQPETSRQPSQQTPCSPWASELEQGKPARSSLLLSWEQVADTVLGSLRVYRTAISGLCSCVHGYARSFYINKPQTRGCHGSSSLSRSLTVTVLAGSVTG